MLIRPFSTFHSPFVFVYIAKSLFTKQYSLEQIEEKLVPTVATNWREISEFTSQFVKDSRIEMQILKFLQTGSRLSSKELNGNNTPFYLEGADVSLNPNARAKQGAIGALSVLCPPQQTRVWHWPRSHPPTLVFIIQVSFFRKVSFSPCLSIVRIQHGFPLLAEIHQYF